MIRKTKISDWKAAYACKDCQEYLSWYEKFHSNGVCPKCGVCNGVTIVDCIPIPFRKIRTPSKGWKNLFSFFDKVTYEYKD